MAEPGEVSRLLEQVREGDSSAESRLLTLLYADLRRLAAYHLRREHRGYSLQPTVLVHEVYLRVFRGSPPAANNRTHFLAIAAQVMRRYLVDLARARKAQKRGGEHSPIPLDEAFIYNDDRSTEFLQVHEALERLREWSPRQCHIVEMRFFGGMSETEIAEYLRLSPRTVKRDWAMARAWLHAELEA